MPLHRLNAELRRGRGWSLTNLGDIDRQTVAGALVDRHARHRGATFGGLATQVRGLELVLADGERARLRRRRGTRRCSPRPGSASARSACSPTVTLQAVPPFALRADEGPVPLDRGARGLRRAR